MKFNRAITLIAISLLCGAGLAFAITIRGSSGNGQDSDAVDWLLSGRTLPIKLSANGKAAYVARAISCFPNQDVEAALPSPTQILAGSCDSGDYMFLFQVQSTSANVSVVITRLQGFSGLSDATQYGVMICDNSTQNSIEMCTNATASQIPNITATAGKTGVTFAVPGTFPTYPAGTAQQGQGLTFFVITKQANPLPLAFPAVGIR